MMSIRQLGAAFDYKTEAARLSARTKDWRYVLVTFGPNGTNPEVLPLGTMELLDAAFDDAMADDDITYVAAFDRKVDDLVPIRSGIDESWSEGVMQEPAKILARMKASASIKKYGKYMLGAVVLGGVLLFIGKKRGEAAKMTKPALSGLAGYRVSFKHRKLKGTQSLCIEAPTKELALDWAKGMARGAKITRITKSCGRR